MEFLISPGPQKWLQMLKRGLIQVNTPYSYSHPCQIHRFTGYGDHSKSYDLAPPLGPAGENMGASSEGDWRML